MPYVGIRADAWEDVVAKRISADDLSRSRRRAVFSLLDDVEAERLKGLTYMRERDDYKDRLERAMGELDMWKTANAKLSARLKRRTPWATTLKVIVGAGALYGIGSGINAITPDALPFLP